MTHHSAQYGQMNRINGQGTALAGILAKDPPVVEADRASLGTARASFVPSRGPDDGRPNVALELTGAKIMLGEDGKAQHLWRIAAKGDGGLPPLWIRPGRNLFREVEEQWLAYGWERSSPSAERELWRGLAVQARTVSRRVVFQQAGWHNWEGKWIFVHAGGAISPSGAVPSVEARLASPFDRYCLPPPSADSSERKAAALSAFVPLTLGLPLGVAIPLWCALWAPPLQGLLSSNLTIFLHGKTGTFKTSLLRLWLGAWGCPTDRSEHLLAYASSQSALERLLDKARHVPVVVDGYVPVSGRAREDPKLELLLRRVADQPAHWRCSGGGSLQQLGFEGLLLITGEAPPQKDSLRARTWLISTDKYGLAANLLERLNENVTRDGSLRQAVADYLSHLAGRWEDLKRDLPRRWAEVRERISSHRAIHHPRRAEMAALLSLAGELFLEYAEGLGVIDARVKGALQTLLREVLAHLAANMDHPPGADPLAELPVSLRFLVYLRQALEIGKGHLRPAGRVAYGLWDQWGWEHSETSSCEGPPRSKPRKNSNVQPRPGPSSGLDRSQRLLQEMLAKLNQAELPGDERSSQTRSKNSKTPPKAVGRKKAPDVKEKVPSPLEEPAIPGLGRPGGGLEEILPAENPPGPEEAGWQPRGRCLGYVAEQGPRGEQGFWAGTLYVLGEEAYRVIQGMARELRLPPLPPYRELLKELWASTLLVETEPNRHTVRKWFAGSVRRYLAFDLQNLREVEHYLDPWRPGPEWNPIPTHEEMCTTPGAPLVWPPPLDPTYGPLVSRHPELEEAVPEEPPSSVWAWLERVAAAFPPTPRPHIPETEGEARSAPEDASQQAEQAASPGKERHPCDRPDRSDRNEPKPCPQERLGQLDEGVAWPSDEGSPGSPAAASGVPPTASAERLDPCLDRSDRFDRSDRGIDQDRAVLRPPGAVPPAQAPPAEAGHHCEETGPPLARDKDLPEAADGLGADHDNGFP